MSALEQATYCFPLLSLLDTCHHNANTKYALLEVFEWPYPVSAQTAIPEKQYPLSYLVQNKLQRKYWDIEFCRGCPFVIILLCNQTENQTYSFMSK